MGRGRAGLGTSMRQTLMPRQKIAPRERYIAVALERFFLGIFDFGQRERPGEGGRSFTNADMASKVGK
jgi:hypothetical protein